MRRVVPALLFLTLIGACRGSDAAPSDPRDARAEELLVRYIRANTSEPGGSYEAAVALLTGELRRAGIEPQVLAPAGAAGPTVYARLASGNASAPALLLLHHMDVVPAEAAAWSVPPFAGERRGGYIWGRGAVDVKSLGIAHLEAFADLARRRAPLRRDLVFLAVPGEERGGERGLALLLEKHPELFAGVGGVLGEGGRNDTHVDRVAVWSIDVQEKVPLWLRVHVRARGGHGAAVADGESASERLIDVLSDLRRQLAFEPRLLPEVETMIRSRSRAFGGRKAAVMREPRRHWNSGELAGTLGAGERAVLRDSLTVTTLRAGSVVNAAPSEAFAELDLRLLPDTDVDDVLTRVRRIIGERGTVEVLLQGTAAPPSPTEHELYQLLERALTAAERRSIVVPQVAAGTTDNRFLRDRGIPAYGFSPFKLNFYDFAGVHGVDERIRRNFFAEGVRLMRQIVAAYCVAE